jgi:hypothetical protein
VLALMKDVIFAKIKNILDHALKIASKIQKDIIFLIFYVIAEIT